LIFGAPFSPLRYMRRIHFKLSKKKCVGLENLELSQCTTMGDLDGISISAIATA
jgi:hypothetical protein